MSDVTRRVLELFLEASNKPVTHVTGVTKGEVGEKYVTGGVTSVTPEDASVTPQNPSVTPVTYVTCQKQHDREKVCAGAAWAGSQEERAAIAEHDAGAPCAWAEALARLDSDSPPCDVPPKRWLRFIDDCGLFLDAGWADQAIALGWGPFDLFGCDRSRPYARIDRMGLLWQINGQRLLALTADSATISTANDSSLTFKRVPNDSGRVLAWQLRVKEQA